MSSRLASNASRPFKLECHICSHSYESTKARLVPCLFLFSCLGLRQVLSMVCVWVPLTGSTKLYLCLTVRWAKPLVGKLLYACHSSVMIVVPALTRRVMIGRSVIALLSGSVSIKYSRLSRQIPSKTHYYASIRPAWFFSSDWRGFRRFLQ